MNLDELHQALVLYVESNRLIHTSTERLLLDLRLVHQSPM